MFMVKADSGIEHFGRWHTQEFIARSPEMIDVLTYLRAERALEMSSRVFVTADSYHFSEREQILRFSG